MIINIIITLFQFNPAHLNNLSHALYLIFVISNSINDGYFFSLFHLYQKHSYSFNSILEIIQVFYNFINFPISNLINFNLRYVVIAIFSFSLILCISTSSI